MFVDGVTTPLLKVTARGTDEIVGTRPQLPCEGSTEPCTRFSISRDPGMGAAELSDCNVKRVHALAWLYSPATFSLAEDFRA